MVEDNNEIEWRRHLLTALDGVAKKVDENSAEHVLIRAEIASVKNDVTAMKSTNPDKKLDDYISSGRGWRILVAGQAVTILVLIGSFIWNFSALNSTVTHLHENQMNVMKDVDDLKITSIGYRDFKIKSKNEVN